MSSLQLTSSPLAAEDYFWRDREAVHPLDAWDAHPGRAIVRLTRSSRKNGHHETTAFALDHREAHPTD